MSTPHSEALDIPELMEYRVGNVWANRRTGVFRFVNRLLSAPVDSGGQAVDYRKVGVNLHDTSAWNRFSGIDMNGSPAIRRTWRHAACLAMPAALIKEVEKVCGEDNVRHAVARVNLNGDVLAGPLPEGVSFGAFNPYSEEDTERRTLLCRIGPHSIVEVATPALILPQEGKLLVPDKVEVLDEAVYLPESIWQGQTRTPVV